VRLECLRVIFALGGWREVLFLTAQGLMARGAMPQHQLEGQTSAAVIETFDECFGDGSSEPSLLQEVSRALPPFPSRGADGGQPLRPSPLETAELVVAARAACCLWGALSAATAPPPSYSRSNQEGDEVSSDKKGCRELLAGVRAAAGILLPPLEAATEAAAWAAAAAPGAGVSPTMPPLPRRGSIVTKSRCVKSKTPKRSKTKKLCAELGIICAA